MAPTSGSAAPNSTGPVAVVTGATSGIGLEIARGLAVRGARTVLVGRGVERVAAVARSVQQGTGNPFVESVGVRDLALRAEVRSLAAELLDRYPRIGILVNNAGAMYTHRETTSEGTERTFALNVLSPFLLTSVLARRLIESAPARVVNDASAAHRGRTVDFQDLEGKGRYGGYRAYGQSKLELILLTRELSRRFEGTGVSVNAVHPGFVRSGFGLNTPGATAAAIRVLGRLFGKSTSRGAETPLFVAADPSLGGTSGQYFSDHTVRPGSPQSREMANARRLYDVCRELTGAPELPEPSGGSAGYSGTR